MENFTAIFFWLCAFSVIISSLGLILSKKNNTALFFMIIISLIFGGLFLLLHSVINAVAQVVVGLLGVCGIFFYLFKKTSANKESWLAFKPRMFFGIALILLFFVALLWGLIDNYLANLWDILSSVHLSGVGLLPVNKVWSEIFVDFSVVVMILLFIAASTFIGVNFMKIVKEREQ